MTSPVDICNRALGEMGARVTIAALTENSPAAVYCALNYQPLRQQLLRTAHWAFARKTAALSLLGTMWASPPTSPVPWQFKYAYPSDCLGMRYVLPLPPVVVASNGVPVTGTQFFVPWRPPSREFRYLVSYDDSTSDNSTTSTTPTPTKVLLTNVGFNGQSGQLGGGLAVYTVDVTDPSMWDSLFTDAMVAGLANKLIIPLSGNVKMKGDFARMARMAILEARVADGNEAIPSTDHSVDWMRARGIGSPFGYGPGGNGFGFGDVGGMGDWMGGYGSVSWGG